MTLEQILQKVGSYVDQDATTPTSSDLVNRTNFVNMAYDEWAETTDWPELISTYTATVSGTSITQMSLPTNFSKVQSPLYVEENGSTFIYDQYRTDEWLTDTTKYTFYLSGNYVEGYKLNIPKCLENGSIINLKYKAKPSTLSGLTAQPVLSNPNYLVQRTIAYVLESRGDTRFPTAKADAERLMAMMLESQNTATINGRNNLARNYYGKNNFIIGRR